MLDETEPKRGLMGAAVPVDETDGEYRARLGADLAARRAAGERAGLERGRQAVAAVLGLRAQHGPPPAPASE